MKTTKYLMMAAAATAFAACSNDMEVVNDGPVAAQISAGVSGPSTRAVDDKWEADEIGVMVTNATKSDMAELYKNVKYTTTATTDVADFAPTTGGGIFFQDATETVTFAAYGPYKFTSDAKDLPENGVIASLPTTDQSTRNKQKAFDFIHASGVTASRSSSTVQFKEDHAFAHKMTRLVIIVKTSAEHGFSAADVAGGTYKLSGLKHEGTFNVKNGEAQATGNTMDDWSLSSNSLLTPDEVTQCKFTSILYPQTLATALTFTATVNGQTYSNNSSIKPALDAGTSYEYTITVQKEGLTVSGCKISNWGTGTGGSGTATMPTN